ncbi:hypothetical protein Tco_0919910 [Tanacetum coccineum]
MDTSKRGTIPMQPNVDLSKSQGPSTPAEVKRMKGIPYASAVGSIMYAVRCTRPDVSFSQDLTSRYLHNLGESHWTVVKNILKYLRNTKDMFIVYGGDSTTELSVTCYIDAKAEYIATAEVAMEAIWIRKFIYGLGVIPNINKPMDMYYDYTGIPKKDETRAVLAIREGKIQKDQKKQQGAQGKAKGKNKLAYAPKTKIHLCLREIFQQRNLSATTARRLVTGGGIV